jgi:hypothetical protein
MREPNFFLVGAGKAGTTSLFHYLDQHPQIYMSPVKEPSYFSLECRPENMDPAVRKLGYEIEERTGTFLLGPMTENLGCGIVRDWEHYMRLYLDARNERAIGEASVSYLWSRTAAEGIARHFPNARILMVLRSPADRAFSHYMHSVSDGFTSKPFRDYVHVGLQPGCCELAMQRTCLEMGLYADQVQRYLDRFPRERIGIWLYEDTRQRPREFLCEVMEFLGVDSSFTPDTTRRYNQPHVARFGKSKRFLRRLGVWQAVASATPSHLRQAIRKAAHKPPGAITMSAQDRAMLVGYYHEDICRLEKLLGRDLTAWRTC